MTWSLFRWVWQLDGPLYVGMPPAGSLNRTRLYVPARALWGALTAEIARVEAESGIPEYRTVGDQLRKECRFTYLFPAEKENGRWNAWLPSYRDGLGLAWRRENCNKPPIPDRAFRRRMLFTRPGTSINASTDSTEDGSLRETECIQTHWRDDQGKDAGKLALVGYMFLRAEPKKVKQSPKYRRLVRINTLFVGGDTRYGLGRLTRVNLEVVKSATIYDMTAKLEARSPMLVGNTVLAHAKADLEMVGALELVGGWEVGRILSLDQADSHWQPGSRCQSSATWEIDSNGVWTVAE